MRAAVLYQPGTIPTFTDFEEPVADDGHELLEVLLAGLNPVDLYIAAGMYGELSVPCVVGLEGIARLANGGRFPHRLPLQARVGLLDAQEVEQGAHRASGTAASKTTRTGLVTMEKVEADAPCA